MSGWMSTFLAFRCGTALAFVLAALTSARGGPENTVVVVNADSWASTCIANEYVKAREIPPWNVVYLSDLPSFESLPVEEFRKTLLTPVLQALESRGLALQTDAILYSSDFPTMIDVSGDVGQQKISPALTPYGSITGLTYLYQAVMSKTPASLDLGSNFYLRRAAMPTQDSAWTNEDREKYMAAMAMVQEAGKQAAAQRKQPGTGGGDATHAKLTEALDTMTKLKEKHPHASELLYNLGCALALVGKPEDAVLSLQRAADTGWWEVRNAEHDEDLAMLRGRPDFDKFLAHTRTLRFDPQPSAAFRGAIGWLPSGQPTSPDQGRSYVLSTMLACTSGRGNSVREALASLKRSIAADGHRPRGTVYYLKNGDVRSTTREWGFDPAVEKLKAAGVIAVIESGVLPQGKNDVAGLTVGAAQFDWAASGSTIMPGAICEHLTSFGGMMNEGDGQTPLSEFIRHGAAAAAGTVSEPFALQAKFPTPFIHTFYAQGCSIAEAFYQSLSGPYQLLIVGDALGKLWGRKLQVTADGLSARDKLTGVIHITPHTTSPDAIEAAIFELYVDGKRAMLIKNGSAFAWDTRSVPDGAHDIAVVASGTDSVATQGRLVLPVEVRNSDSKLEFSGLDGSERAWNRPFELKASMPGAKEIVIMQNVRPVGRIQGDSGSASIDPAVLGQGPVRLLIVAFRNGEGPREVVGHLDFTVVPPRALPALPLPGGASLADDFDLTVGDHAASQVKRAEGDWLAKAGVAKDTPFSVEGWFEVGTEEVYQFQMHGNVKLDALTVDGVKQSWPRGKEWWFVPVNLAKGLHRVSITGHGVDAPTLDVRFGGPGAARLDGRRFRHLRR